MGRVVVLGCDDGVEVWREGGVLGRVLLYVGSAYRLS